MYRLFTIFVFGLIGAFATGCGALFSGTSEDVQVNSSPAGASVFVNGYERGRTPMTLNLESSKSHYIKVSKDGYHDQTVHLGYSVGAGWVILDLLGGFFPVVIDAATGGWNQLDRTNVNVMLSEEKEGSAAIDAIDFTTPAERADQIAAMFGV